MISNNPDYNNNNIPAAPIARQLPSDSQDHFDILSGIKLVWDAILQYKWVLIISCAIALGLAVLYIKVWPPVYAAEALVVVEMNEDASRDRFYVNWNIFRKEDARTEIELATSGPVLHELITEMDLKYDDVYHPFTSQLKYFWETSWPGRKYQEIKDKFMKNELAALSEEEKDRGKTLKDLRAGITFYPVGESNAGKLKVKGPSPRVAEMANTLLDIYMKRRLAKLVDEAQQAYDALDKEVQVAAAALDDHAARRLKFMQENELHFDLQKEAMQVEQLAQIELEIEQIKRNRAHLSATKQVVEAQLAKMDEGRKITSTTSLNAIKEAAKLRRMELTLTLQQAQERYVEDSPEIRELKKNLATVEEILSEEPAVVEASVTYGLNEHRDGLVVKLNSVASELAGVEASLKAAQEAAAKYKTRLSRVPEMQRQMTRLDRDFNISSEVYNVLMARRAQAEVALTTTKTTMPSFRVAGRAEAPSSKTWPTMKIVIPMALILGFIVGMAIAIFLRLINGTVTQESLDGQVFDMLTVARVERPLQLVKK